MADSHLRPPTTPTSARPGFNYPRQPTSSRLPPPQLFQGPPSRNASRISFTLPGSSPSTLGSSPPNQQQKQQQPRPSHVPPASSFSGPSLSQRPRDVPSRAFTDVGGVGQKSPGATAGNQSEYSARAEALWTEMQNTLAEVEISTMNSSHVFRESHARALEELRQAQLGLAQAWAKSEADEMGDQDREFEGQTEDDDESPDAGPGATTKEAVAPLAAVKTSGEKGDGGNKGTNTSKGNRKAASKSLEEETERDILLARKRREANDRYFGQVNKGILDVVKKLEEVAGVMRKVEAESREIWNENEDSAVSDEEERGDEGDEEEEEEEEEEEGEEEEEETGEEDVEDQQRQRRQQHHADGSDTESAVSDSPKSDRK